MKTLEKVDTKLRPETVLMTPDRAMELLSTADPNRTVHERRVSSLARDMIAGQWLENGETIKLAPDGKLIDGEHRLWGLVRAAEHGVKSLTMMIVYNVDRKARQTIDTGKARSYADVLKIRGHAGKGRLIASTLRFIVLYRAGNLSGVRGSVMVTHQELDAACSDTETMARIEFFEENYSHGMRYTPAAAFVYWRAAQDDEDKAQAWARGVQTGVEMKANDPRYQLRERFHEPSTRKMHQQEALALAIKSWNLFSMGETVSNLRWRSRGNTAESFPDFLVDQRPSRRSGLRPDETLRDSRARDRARTRKTVIGANGR